MSAITVNSQRAVSVEISVPTRGPWFADVVFEEDPKLSGQVNLSVGNQDFVGTIDDRFSGSFRTQQRVRISAGGGGWNQLVPAKGFHNDAGVLAKNIVTDVAALVGETIGDFAAVPDRVGIDYARSAGPASAVINRAAGSASWWVDFAGVTHVGERPSATPNSELFQIIGFNSQERIIEIASDDLSVIQVGSTITLEEEGDQLVQEICFKVAEESSRLFAWVGQSSGRGRLSGALYSLAKSIINEKLWGMYKYRVVQMSGNRVELQAVNVAAGVPDILPISMWPGFPGVHADLSPSTEVLVQFVEGDPAQPVITHFVGKDGGGFSPVTLLVAGDSIQIGSDSASEAMVLGDQLKSWLETHTHPTGVGPSGVPVQAATLSNTLSTRTTVD